MNARWITSPSAIFYRKVNNRVSNYCKMEAYVYEPYLETPVKKFTLKVQSNHKTITEILTLFCSGSNFDIYL